MRSCVAPVLTARQLADEVRALQGKLAEAVDARTAAQQAAAKATEAAEQTLVCVRCRQCVVRDTADGYARRAQRAAETRAAALAGEAEQLRARAAELQAAADVRLASSRVPSPADLFYVPLRVWCGISL
jgi:hypothetical protein